MIKRIGILTINYGLMNYGNRLQNYALQATLEKMGYDVKTVDYSPTYPERQISLPARKKSSIFVKAVKILLRPLPKQIQSPHDNCSFVAWRAARDFCKRACASAVFLDCEARRACSLAKCRVFTPAPVSSVRNSPSFLR